MKKEPNHAVEPTPVNVTDHANACSAPFTSAAHLKREAEIKHMAYSRPKGWNISYAPKEMRAFFVYGYEYVDDLNFLHEPFEHTPAEYKHEDYIAEAKARFLDAGWAGDGDIRLIWIPPFMLPPTDDNDHMGVLLWFVKQDSDGISWILSPVDLSAYFVNA